MRTWRDYQRLKCRDWRRDHRTKQSPGGRQQASKDIQSELRQVERLLKFNPKNTELLAQKQKLLGDQVATTRDKLDRLRQVQGQINEQFKKGEISEGQYRAFQREIIETESKLKNFEKQLKSTQDRSKEFADRMGEVSEKLQKAGKAFAPVSAAAGAVSTGLVGLAVNAGRVADDLNTLTVVTGLSTETLQKFKYAEDVIDVSTETLAKSLARLTRRMGDAQYGTERTNQAFDKLGVNIYDTSGSLRDSEDVFHDVIDALGKIEGQAERDAVSMELFGRSAQELNPLILGGADALKKMGDEAERAGLIMSQETLDAINEFNDEIDILKATASATFAQMGATIGQALLPALKSLAERLKGVLAWVRSLDERTLVIITTVGALVAAITPLLLVAAKITAAVKVLVPLFLSLKAAIAGFSAPVLATVAAVAALAAVAVEVYRNWEQVKTALSATWDLLKAKASQMTINISIAFEKMRGKVLEIVGEIMEKLSAMEDLPFGIGEKFAGMKDSISDSVGESAERLAELEKAAEENAKTIEMSTEGTKAAFRNLGQAVADDVKGLISAFQGQTEAITEQTETATNQEKKQTAAVSEETQKRIQLWNEEARKRNEINRLAREEEIKQDEIAAEKIQQILDKRTAYEDQWNQRLLQMRDQYQLSQAKSEEEALAIRMQQLQKQREAEIKNAESIGADVYAIKQYYDLKERELLNQKDEAYKQSFINTANAMGSFFQSVVSGEKSFKDAMKGMIISFISALQQQTIAAQAAGVATAWAQAPATFGASLAWIGKIASAIGPALVAFEGAKAAVAALAEGGKVTAPTVALIGEGA